MRYSFLAKVFHQLKDHLTGLPLITKNISLEITKRVELKNLVAKKI